MVIIAIGLAADSFAVSVSSGAIIGKMRIRYAMRIAVFFSFFQGLMPWVGWKIGSYAKGYIEAIDHWLAFVLLCGIGAKMIYESRQLQDEPSDAANPLHVYILFTLAIATSIDALVVGGTFSFLNIEIFTPVAIIGAVTFIFSFAGAYVGDYFGHLFEDKIELAGGLVLIGMGVKILLEHTLFQSM